MNPAHSMSDARSLLPVLAYASADGHEWEVLEGDDGRLVVSVDGQFPYSFTAGAAEGPREPARRVPRLPEADPN